jgi:hypothetical protein
MNRYEFRLSNSPRDRRIAAWIEYQKEEGRNPAELIKNLLDEAITGKSYLTGKPIQYQGDIEHLVPDNPDNPVMKMFLGIED